MNYKAIMLHDVNQSRWLEEMAVKELRQVEKIIRAGDINTAAQKYIELGGSSAGITKTVNTYLKKNPSQDPAPFQKFREEVVKIKTKTAPSEKRAYTKAKTTGTTKEGEKVVTTGQSQEAIKKQNLKRFRKEGGEVKKEADILEKGTDEQKQKLASDILNDWGYNTLGKKPSLEDEVATVLWKYGREKSEASKEDAVVAMKKIIQQGGEHMEQLAQAALSRKPVFPSSHDKRTKKKQIVAKAKRMAEDILYENMLKDTYDYRGIYFWENYVLSNIVRTFPKHILEYGEKNAVEMFVAVYGKEARPLFEYMIENEDMLIETALVAGKGLLFEDIGEKNMTKYLTEAESNKLSKAGANFSKLLVMSRRNVGSAMAQGGSSSKILGFLKGLWSKFKDIGKEAFSKIVPLLRSKFKWAKELVTQGVGWIASNPIARVAVPALIIGGTVFGAVKLINRLRKKSGKKEMSQQEVSAIKDVEQNQKTTLDMYRKKPKVA